MTINNPSPECFSVAREIIDFMDGIGYYTYPEKVKKIAEILFNKFCKSEVQNDPQ